MSRVNWNREEQIAFAKKVAKICNRKFNTNFYPKYQGSGPVVVLKMTNKEDNVSNAQKFLIKEFGFTIADPGKHGVGGTLYTLLLNISEVSEETILKIERIKLKKIIKTKIISSVPVILDPVPVVEPVVEVVEKTRRNLDHVSWGRMTVLKFLTPIFRFEKSLNGKKNHPEIEKLFWFDKRVNGSDQVLHCYNEETASKIYPAILWLTGESSGSTLVRLEGKEIIINFSKTEKASVKNQASFCFGPSYDASLTDVEIRLRRICIGCYPILETLEGNSFKISYKKINTVRKIHGLISEMGWNVSELNSDDSFICYLPEVTPTPTESIPVQEISFAEEVPIEVLPENSEPIIEKEQPVSTPTLVFDKKEAWEELNNAYSDHEYFSSLSEETQKKVILTLRNNWKETDPEGFIQKLLSFFE